MIKTR